ncbi:galactomannan galactosyltransferase 1-like [Rhododendron vialii]|uniref:galactomannan galactosyltransferase 1-like n=1 Tax=Rhododendron vialii TaxID=182163 RepID=UPI00265EEB31|nr:galactomannan galactosyltransferase 1-like [Rhododendron vialii]
MGMGRVTETVAKMEKFIGPSKPIFIGVAGAALLMLLLSFSASTSFPNMFDVSKMTISPEKDGAAMKDCTTVSDQGLSLGHDPADQTFYDDPTLSYEIGNPGKNWDEKRREWLKHHPSFATGVEDRVFVLTGSQPSPCKNPIGDHLNLRLFKNKVDYCRIHGYDIFYNNAFIHPKMVNWWIKIAVLRPMMLAHPEAEWIFWVDSDAVITDMDFKLPLEKYKNHNFVVPGGSDLVYDKKSWGGLNAGVFYIRNCQWSMEFMEAWAEMGPQTPNYEKWGQIQMEALSDKKHQDSDDQSALVYLLLTEKEKWGIKVYIENMYDLSGYWGYLVDSFDNITENYARIEKGVTELRRRHAEKVSEHYAALMRVAVINQGSVGGGRKRPFITHFTACRHCSGLHWGYTAEQCYGGMEKALNFADNQVLRNYGFVRPDLMNTSVLSPLPFGFSSYNKEK